MRKIEITNQENRNLNRSLWSNLQSLKSTISFMQTGAHPDDETTGLLAKLSLEDGYHVSYINAVRGQGGQNSLGVERDDKLGAIRTLELIRAMSMLRVDVGWLGIEKFDSIRDFSFSKSGEETFAIWGKEHTIKQMILMVRAFKPDIIIPTFLDVNGQHGHHRAVTRATIKAYDLAGDKSIYPEIAFDEWKISQIFLPAWGGGGGSYDDEEDPPEANYWIEVGNFNSIFGGTYNQIGQWSRAYHASQGMGKILPEESIKVPLHLLKGKFHKDDITGGLLPKNLNELSEFSNDKDGNKILIEAQKYSEDAIENFNHTENLIKSISNLKLLLDKVESKVSKEHVHRIKLKKKQCSAAMADCLSLLPSLEFKSNKHYVGGNFEANLSFHNQGIVNFEHINAELFYPFKTRIDLVENSKISSNRENFIFTGKLTTEESYLDLYQPWHGLALNPAGVYVLLKFTINNVNFSINVVPQNQFSIIPETIGSIEKTEMLNIISSENNNGFSKVPIKFFINKFSENKTILELNLPDKWICKNKKFELQRSNPFEASSYSFDLNMPNSIKEGVEIISLNADKRLVTEISEFGYDHIGNIIFEDKCDLSILSLDIKPLSNLKIGWIDGYLDKAWHWARSLGAEVTLLNDEQMLSGDFSKFDTIVSGVFSSGKRPTHKISRKIKEWIKNGGNYVTEYHRPHDNWDEHQSSPYFLKIGSPSIRWRVTQPDANVTFLDPKNILLNEPNIILPKDFDGWHKERGLYFASEWDKKYTPIISVSDNNETPLKGGLLICNYGKGRHVHCALNLFYQMDKLVPGPFRIFANILSN